MKVVATLILLFTLQVFGQDAKEDETHRSLRTRLKAPDGKRLHRIYTKQLDKVVKQIDEAVKQVDEADRDLLQPAKKIARDKLISPMQKYKSSKNDFRRQSSKDDKTIAHHALQRKTLGKRMTSPHFKNHVRNYNNNHRALASTSKWSKSKEAVAVPSPMQKYKKILKRKSDRLDSPMQKYRSEHKQFYKAYGSKRKAGLESPMRKYKGWDSKASENKSEPVAKNDSKEKSDLLHPAWKDSKASENKSEPVAKNDSKEKSDLLHPAWKDSKASENKSEPVAKNDSKEKSDLLHPAWRKQWKSGP